MRRFQRLLALGSAARKIELSSFWASRLFKFINGLKLLSLAGIHKFPGHGATAQQCQHRRYVSELYMSAGPAMLQHFFSASSRHSYTIQATTQRRRLRFLFELFLGGRVPKDPPPHGPVTILNSHPREKRRGVSRTSLGSWGQCDTCLEEGRR